jgi:hypothetical protein
MGRLRRSAPRIRTELPSWASPRPGSPPSGSAPGSGRRRWGTERPDDGVDRLAYAGPPHLPPEPVSPRRVGSRRPRQAREDSFVRVHHIRDAVAAHHERPRAAPDCVAKFRIGRSPADLSDKTAKLLEECRHDRPLVQGADIGFTRRR